MEKKRDEPTQTRHEESISEERRRLLRMTSAGGLAILLGACDGSAREAAETETPAANPGSATPTDEELDEVAKILWQQFDEGTKAWTKDGKVEMVDADRQNRENHHRPFISSRWSDWNKGKRLAMQCAWNTGYLSAMLCKREGTDKITKAQFMDAAEAVKVIQSHRKGLVNPVGLAC